MPSIQIPEDHPLRFRNRADVAGLFGLSTQKLNFWLYALPPEQRYRVFEITRANRSAPRRISSPILPIKRMQQQLAKLLQEVHSPSPPTHAFARGRSILSNASYHQGREWVLRVDLKDFFPSINFGRVRGLFLARPFAYPPDVATLVAHLCCHERQLPQGAPTSPVLSNLVCRRLDARLLALARRERCAFTRYCDDLVFSSDRRPPATLVGRSRADQRPVVGARLRRVIEAEGFSVNDQKTLLMRRGQRQMVTGLVVNSVVNVPRERVRTIRALTHIWGRYGLQAAADSYARQHIINSPPGKPAASFSRTIRGKLQFIGSVKGFDHAVYAGLSRRLRERDDTFNPTLRPAGGVPLEVEVWVEGQTDEMHLRTALAHLRRTNPEYLSFRLTVKTRSQGRGGVALLRLCQEARELTNQVPLVFLFDSDDRRIIRHVRGVDPDGIKDWGNAVYSLLLPTPPFRTPIEPLCIELLYPDDVLGLRNQDGRRLYRKAEFDPVTDHHVSEAVIWRGTNRSTLIRDTDVLDATGRRVSLSKHVFAELIVEGAPPFHDVDFSGFHGVFTALVQVRQRYLQSRFRRAHLRP